jgi:hypothetical protein
MSSISGTLLALTLAALPVEPASQPARPTEYEVKAVFLERFARFVEWPDEPAPGHPFKIVVVGPDPFGGLLEQVYGRRTIRSRPVEILHAAGPADVGDCDLLFAGSAMARRAEELVELLRGRPVLLVGDAPGFVQSGFHLAFFVEQDTVRFAAGPQAFRRSGLKVSYLLMQVARVVDGAGGPP